MPSNQKVKRDFDEIKAFREGAHYCKMDLHTHTPASECSSFTFPKEIEDVLPLKKSNSASWYDQCFQFLEDLEKGRKPIIEAYRSKALEKRPYLKKRQALDRKALQTIAKSWLGEIRTLYAGELEGLPASVKKIWKTHIKNAMGDLRSYLKSLFFIEEYLIRCYIEGLQIVFCAFLSK